MMEPIEVELLSMLRSFEDRLSPSDYSSIHELISAREWGVGFDAMCTQLYEFGRRISREEYERVETAGIYMGLPKETWQILKQLVV